MLRGKWGLITKTMTFQKCLLPQVIKGSQPGQSGLINKSSDGSLFSKLPLSHRRGPSQPCGEQGQMQ